ncbi:MAG: NAD(P)-dependent oxidoreductase [Patescibacteria group bacterium]
MHRNNNRKKNAIVVTGALGHIGSALIRTLGTHTSDPIILIDNLATQRFASLFDLPSEGNYEFVYGDICEMELQHILSRARVLIHLAARTDAESSAEHNEETERVNTFGFRRIADACLEHDAALIFPSTTSIYGSQNARVDETCKELQPQSPYAATKLSGEEYVRALHVKGLRVIILRLGTIFGWSIGMRFHTAVNKFIWQSAFGHPLTVWETAWEQRRPYVDLEDAIHAIMMIIDNALYDGETYNVITSNLTVRQVVETIQRHMPTAEVKFVASKIMNQLSYEIDGSKFERHGFKPHGDLDRAVRDTLAHLSGKRAL